METLTLVLCLAVGITAVPLPEPQILALPAQPVILLSRPATLRTNAVESYVVIDEEKGDTPETDIYFSTPTESPLYIGYDEEIGKPSEAESSIINSSAPTNELPLQINNDVEKEINPESEVNTVSSHSSTELSLSDDSQEFAESMKPAQPIVPADKPIPCEPEATPAAEESKPQGGNQEASSTSSSSSGGIFSWLNPFHLPAPSIPTLSHIPFISNLPNLPSLPSVPSLQSVNIANLPSLSNLPSLPIKWPSWLPRPGGSSPSKYIAFRSPVYIYYS